MNKIVNTLYFRKSVQSGLRTTAKKKKEKKKKNTFLSYFSNTLVFMQIVSMLL